MDRETIRHQIPLWTVLGFVLVIGGCGGDDHPRVYPVSGKVLVDGKPAAKAQITFYPLAGPTAASIPFAETEADGSFRPSTRLSGDGAPSGDYTLVILWPEIKLDHGEEIAGFDRLGRRYADPKSSDLRVTIKEGENVLPPFKLMSSARSPARASGPAGRVR